MCERWNEFNGKSNRLRKINIMIQWRDAICDSCWFVALFLFCAHFIRSLRDIATQIFALWQAMARAKFHIKCSFRSDSFVFLTLNFELVSFASSTNCLPCYLPVFFYHHHHHRSVFVSLVHLTFSLHFRFPIRIPLESKRKQWKELSSFVMQYDAWWHFNCLSTIFSLSIHDTRFKFNYLQLALMHLWCDQFMSFIVTVCDTE